MMTLPGSPSSYVSEEAVDRKISRFLERARYVGDRIGWDSVVGHDHAKRELRVVAAALTNPGLAERLGVPLVKGVVVTGPSGTGKTLLARAFAGEVDRPVFVLSSADLTPGRIRRTYESLRNVPSVVVIDEIDIVAARSYGEARSKTVGALCVALDGILPVDGPITVGLTAEAITDLDPSVVRSGRLTTEIRLDLPDRADRLALWQLYTARIPRSEPLDLEMAADRSQGMSGADIAAISRAAAGLALADGLSELSPTHLDEALERRGVVRRPPVRGHVDRHQVAIHEAGHAVFAFSVLGRDALNEAVISRSGRGEGHVSLRTEWGEESGWRTREWRQEAQLSLAGIVAEELILTDGLASFGSERDIATATDIVLRAHAAGLVGGFGRVATERVERGPDPESYDERGSEAMRSALWESVRSEVSAAETACREVLAAQRDAIERLADALDSAGSLSGARLVTALVEGGATEATR
jgi:ATP-dependent Zn protease